MPQKKRNDRDGKIIRNYGSDLSYTSVSLSIPSVLSDDDANSSQQHPITKNSSKVQHDYAAGSTLHPDWSGGTDGNGVDDGAA